MKINVFSVPRSGSKYFAMLLNAAGVYVGFHKEDMHGCTWKHAYWRYHDWEGNRPDTLTKVEIPAYDKSIHLVREPYACVYSLAEHITRFRSEQYHRLGFRHPNQVENAAQIYIQSHALIEEKFRCGYRQRIEHVGDEWTTLCAYLGIDHPMPQFPRLPNQDEKRGEYLDDIRASTRAQLDILKEAYGYG